MWKRAPKKELGVLDRKPPSNPKYKNVVGKLNTGMTVDKLKGITAREYVKRRDEIHYRINKRQLFELYDEYERADEENFADSDYMGGGRGGGGGGGGGGEEGGRHSPPRIVTHSELALPAYEKPYLLLDVRPVEQFNFGHLMQARSYPYTMIRRDFMHPEIFKFKNQENELIIVYCDDEKMSLDVAKTLVDRGVDNVFLLTGGMNEFAVHYPSCVEGHVPSLPTPPQRPKPFAFLAAIREDGVGGDDSGLASARGGRPVFSAGGGAARGSPLTARSSAASSRRSQRGGAAVGGADADDTRSESGMSVRSNFSVAESIYSRATSRRGLYRPPSLLG